MQHSESEQMSTGFKSSQMLKTPTKNGDIQFDTQKSSSKLNGDVMAQGAIGSFFAKSNSKAKFGSNSKFESLNNLTKTITDNTDDQMKGGMYDSFHGSRRKSQGENFNLQTQPSVEGGKNLSMVSTLPNGLSNFASRSGSDFRVGKVMKKRATCPIEPTQQSETQFDCVTPTKAKNSNGDEDEIIEQDESSNEKQSNDDSNSDEEEDDEAEQERLAQQQKKDLDDIKKFAAANGFEVIEEKPKKTKSPHYEKFVLTQEILDEQQKLDRERFVKEMYVPPPLEILTRKYTNKEPVRTGFNQGLLPVKIKNNFEKERAPQGPQIVVTTSSAMQRRRDNSISSRASERSSRAGKRSLSREGSLGAMDTINKGDQSAKSQFRGQDMTLKEFLKDKDSKAQADDDLPQVQQVVQQSHNSETSLRHLFYLEYKKNFPEGQTNPIVYSRFGKKSYNSNEAFDMDNFNQLVRTCNLKKILKSQESKGLCNNGKDRKFSEPISFPSCDYYKPKNEKDKTLVFESRFESGNLQLAHKVSDSEYDLILQNDINSKGHTQWFFFRVANTKKGQKVKFNMLNMIKSKSLYNEGMKVLIYSEQKQEQAASLSSSAQKKEKCQEGWQRGGEDLSYYQNNYRKDQSQQTNYQRCYYTFTFTHTFENDHDQVYFAYSQPYTYTDLTEDLCEIQSKHLNYVSRNTLCRTIAGNKCEYLTITNRVPFEVDQKKEGVVITGRIHPGESNSSFMMKGVIDFLVSDDPKAHELRDKFVFKIVPMLNPDGVINGNYRCSLAGCDLNRRWKYPSEILHPTVYNTKKLIMKLAKERPLALYCDLHGHSRRKNVFMYGNCSNEEQEASRIFPFLMSKIAQPHFSYDYSRFCVGRGKEQTARVAMWRDLGQKHPNIFTMEASFCGPKPVKYEPHRGSKKAPTNSEMNYHFNTEDLCMVGQKLCETLILYRSEKEETLGLSNAEYLVQQYHLDKEAKMEQETLIKQQQAMTEQRRMQEIQNRLRNHQTFKEDEPMRQQMGTKESLRDQNVKEVKNQDKFKEQSAKKVIKKMKTEKIDNDEKEKDEQGSQLATEGKQKKRKVNYNIKEEGSDGESDSEPSEDNLDADQIMKLIPKKFGKKKYIKGVEEQKKKVAPKTEIKVPKKPKTMLMPCMSQKKEQKEVKSTRNNSESAIKKSLNTFKFISYRLRNGGKQRDVGTQIQFKGDGTDLSLMEMDILRHTGCAWSHILYPGFKGYIKPQDKIDNRFKSPADAIKSEQQSQSPNSNHIPQFMASFNDAYRSIVDPSNDSSSLRTNSLRGSSVNSNLSSGFKANGLGQSPFSNDHIKQTMQLSNFNLNNVQKHGSAMKSLQDQIMNANFSEPKSLFGTGPTGNSMINLSSAKKKRIMGMPMPFDYSDSKKATCFDLNLETVHEKVKDDKTPLNISDVKKSGHYKSNQKLRASSNTEGVKKIVNGGIQMQSIPLPPLAEKNEGLQLRAKKKSIAEYQSSNSKSRQLDQKSSFANVAQQILSTNGAEKQGSAQKECALNSVIKYSDLANVAPSQMLQKMAKMSHARTSNLSGSCEREQN